MLHLDVEMSLIRAFLNERLMLKWHSLSWQPDLKRMPEPAVCSRGIRPWNTLNIKSVLICLTHIEIISEDNYLNRKTLHHTAVHQRIHHGY